MRQKRLGLAGIGLAAVAALGACNDHELVPLGDTIVASRQQVSAPIKTNKVDILWLVDDSASMSEEQEKLRREFEIFIDQLSTTSIDWHLAVITTDPDDNGVFQNGPGRARSSSPTCSRPAPQFAYCADRTIAPVLRAVDYLPASGRFDDDPDAKQRLLEDFACISATGDCGKGIEVGLDMIRLALDGSRPENSGFLRDDAYLSLIIVSDEDDCSSSGGFDPSGTNKFCYLEQFRSRLTPVADYYNFLLGLKGGDASRLTFAAIIGPDDSLPLPANDEPFVACSTDDGGVANSGDRFSELLSLLNEAGEGIRGIEESICQGSFATALEKIGAIIRSNIDGNCLIQKPRTCEEDSDCAPGVGCVNPGRPGGASYCADFEPLVEVLDPGATRWVGLAGPGPAASFVRDDEGLVPDPPESAQYVVDYDSERCQFGIAFSFLAGSQPREGGRFRASYPIVIESLLPE